MQLQKDGGSILMIFFNGEVDKSKQTAIFQPAEPFVEEPRGNQNTQEQSSTRCW